MEMSREDRIEGVCVRERILKIERELSIHLENNKKKGCTTKTKEAAAHLDLSPSVSIESIQMAGLHIDTPVHAMDLPKDIMEKILIGFPVKLLMTFKCVSKEWNAVISDDSFRRRYRSQQQSKGNSPTGLICGDDTDRLAFKYGFCVANKFLYTSKNYIEKEELESFAYLNTFRRYVLATSKGLLLLGNDLETLYVYDLVSKKDINLPRNNLEAGYCLSLGFKCEERGANHHPHLCYKVVCVDTQSACRYGKFGKSYIVERYSSETGIWQKSVIKSDINFHIESHLIAKVIRGVFHWFDNFWNSIVAYDLEDPKGRIVSIKAPRTSNYALYREKMSQFEGTKDGSLQFIISNDKMVINVWILMSASGRSYMDEDIVCECRWSLASSVSVCDIIVGFDNFHPYYQKNTRIILADPVDPHIIYFEFANKLYAYDYHQEKVVFTLFQQITGCEYVFVPFEWPTWPCL